MRVKGWDPLVRLFHWALVGAFLANVFLTQPGKTAHQWMGYVVAGLIALRVVWGLKDAIATVAPTIWLTSVDLPTFGRPARPTKPERA